MCFRNISIKNDVIICISGVNTNPNTKPYEVVSEKCVFGHRIRRIHLGGRSKRTRLGLRVDGALLVRLQIES